MSGYHKLLAFVIKNLYLQAFFATVKDCGE